MSRRVSNHSGRKHRNGKVFSSRHADRNYNTKNDPHIDSSLSHLNTYWMNPNLNISAKNFDEFEQAYYQIYYADFIASTNTKHEKSRHYERMTSARKLRDSPRTCVEDTLLYFGDKKNPLPDEVRDAIVAEYIDWHIKTFPQCIVLSYATHRDEPQSAIHTEMRCAWSAIHADGYLYPNQTKALEQMGIQSNGQRKDNAKKEYTRMCRAKQAELLISHGYAVELSPKEGKGGQTMEEFKRDKAIEERKEQEKFIIHPEEKERIESQIRPNRLHKDEVIMSKELANRLIISSIERDKYKQNYERERSFKNENIEREKMGLRIQLNQAQSELKELKERFKDLNDCVRRFVERKGLLNSFLQFVEQYKKEKEERLQRLMRERERAIRREQEQIHHHAR